ncbi:MAG: hypothetical protein FWE38_02250 [Firmicutes bacterium]|nr:hypothetical protein [Bacillota bacterium]
MEKVDKKVVLAAVFGIVLFYGLHSLVTEIISIFHNWGNRFTAVNALQGEGFLTMTRIFTVIILLSFIAILVMSLMSVFCQKFESKRKLFAFISLGLIGLMVVLLIITRIAIPTATLAQGTTPHWGAGLYTSMRTLVLVTLGIPAVLMTVIAAGPVLCCKKSEDVPQA